jgi:hypothetical protein
MPEEFTPWTADPVTGAQLITAYAHALLTGPCGVAFMRQSALGGGADLNAKGILDAAEAMAADAMKRSCERSFKGQKIDPIGILEKAYQAHKAHVVPLVQP